MAVLTALVEKAVRLRNERVGLITGKGILGRCLVGYHAPEGAQAVKPITWHPSGRWRWDGEDHPLDIVDWKDQ